MARKKKGHKELPNTSQQNEQITTTTTTNTPTSNNNLNSQKRASYEDLLQKTTEAAEQKFQQYQSDSELMALKQKLNLEKNKSNLFLIKSYSFIDKTNHKKPLKLKKQNTIEPCENLTQSRNLLETQEQLDSKKKLKNKSNKLKSKLEDKDEKLEKPKKPPKLKKIKKSKSTDDPTDNLQDLQDLLRKPSIIKEGEEHVSNRNALRPQSLPVAKNEHKIVGKAKTLDDLETPRLKRDSFLRHSLQSIRRSFSTSKKHSHHISITSSSSSSASSNSSGVLDLPRKSKSKCNNKDIANLNDVEESNYSMSLQDERKPCQIVITVSDKESQQNNSHINNCSHCTQTLKSTNSSPPPTRSPYSTMDPLTVLKEEEDEKDGNVESCAGRFTTCINAQERSTSSVSTLAQLAPDSLLPMAPLQTHTECQSVQCLNTLDKDYQNSSASLTSNNNNNNNNNNTSSSSPPQQKQKRGGSSTQLQHQLSIPESLQSTSIGCATSSEYTSARSLKHSATSLTPLPSLNSSGSLRSISPSRRSASSNSSSTAKHEQQSTAAAATAAAAAAAAAASAHTLTTSGSNGSSSSSSANAGTTNAAGSTAATTTPPEKEKKRKEISSSRVKKFHRHFAQVSKDEKLINYFSCALVSDILLQGHLYITDQHFAFYSNVFGYVTKVVIPTSSVTKISKEKTAKIIPNAVGVATADERHVFGSFISREAAFRLMCSVCPPLGAPEILPKDPASIEISEEYSIEDDSSCSISGNESPAQITELQNGNTLAPGDTNASGQTILRRSVGSSNLSLADIRHSDIPKTNAKSTATNSQQAASTRASAPPVPGSHYTNGKGLGSGGVSGAGGANVNLLGLKNVLQQPALTNDNAENANKLTIIAGCASSTTSATSTPTPSSSSSPTTVMTPGMSSPITNGSGGTGAITKVKQRVTNIFTSVNKKLSSLHLKFPTEIHVVYLGVMLTLLLSLFSIFLLYRILDIEAKTNYYRSPVEFNWRSGNDDDIFSEALRFQKQLQLKSTEEAQHILKTNLEQIAKVRRSLETLSMLIHDRSSSFVSTHTDDSD